MKSSIIRFEFKSWELPWSPQPHAHTTAPIRKRCGMVKVQLFWPKVLSLSECYHLVASDKKMYSSQSQSVRNKKFCLLVETIALSATLHSLPTTEPLDDTVPMDFQPVFVTHYFSMTNSDQLYWLHVKRFLSHRCCCWTILSISATKRIFRNAPEQCGNKSKLPNRNDGDTGRYYRHRTQSFKWPYQRRLSNAIKVINFVCSKFLPIFPISLLPPSLFSLPWTCLDIMSFYYSFFLLLSKLMTITLFLIATILFFCLCSASLAKTMEQSLPKLYRCFSLFEQKKTVSRFFKCCWLQRLYQACYHLK